MDTKPPLSHLAERLIEAFEKRHGPNEERTITVNPLISKFASWYEKVRNAMDYREQDVILRAAIERILKRRILLGGRGLTIAEPLIRELVWARYFPDDSLSLSIIDKVSKKIDIYLKLRDKIVLLHKINEGAANEWMLQLMSSDLESLLQPVKEKEIMCNFMFQVIRPSVTIVDDNEQTRDSQVFIAVRRAFAKDDVAFLRFALFKQFFGEVKEEGVDTIAASFLEGYKEINFQLHYPAKEKIYSFVKSKTAIFLILGDILHGQLGNIRPLYQNQPQFSKAVFETCEARYNSISAKVRRAIIRSVAFILLTKTFFAFAVEGTFESIVYGKIFWNSIIINTGIPPLLMIVSSLFQRTPGRANTERIISYIKKVLSEEHPKLGQPLMVKKIPDKRPILNGIFTMFWFLTFLVSFGGLIYVLNRINFHLVSQAVFLFFMAIVSFLSYRINVLAHEYTVEEKQGVLSPIFDFFFMPIVRVGRHLTEGIAQMNIIIFVLDFIIEAPFKGLFAFFEQWFFFLHSKREEMG